MKFPTIDKSFFCLSLEVGAFVLAGLSIAASVGVISIASTLLVRYINFYNTLNQTDQDFFQTILITLIFVFIIYVLYFVIVFIASIMVILGTIHRDHNKILLFMILMGVGVIVSFIQVFQLGFLFLIPSILAAVCSIYFFVCIYSLYQVLKAEKMGKLQPDLHPGVDYENVVLRRM